jgi:hypothetical protein
MWWKEEASVGAFVALSNITAQPIQATVQVSDSESKPLGQHSTTVSPHGTKVVTVQELQSALGTNGGLRVTYTGAEEGLVVTGHLQDQSTGYSAAVPFFHTGPMAKEKSTSISFSQLGLMTGAADPMMSFPAGTEFTPFSVVRNISAETVSVRPNFWWMQSGKPESASLGWITLKPYQTVDLKVGPLLSKSGLDAFNGSVNLILDLRGKPHSLLMAGGSVDRSKTYVFQVLARSVEESLSKSMSYWGTGNGDDTMVTLWNPADEAQDFVFTIFFAGGHYDLPVHLEPRVTRIFNISEIIQNQIPDREGNVIPATIHEGSARIAGVESDRQHILIAVDAGTYNVRKATCSYYCIYCGGYLDGFIAMAPFGVANGGSFQMNVYAYWDGNNGQSATNLGPNGTWSSNKTTVATVSVGLVKGVAPGSVTITGFANEPYYWDDCGYDPMCYNSYENLGGSGGGTVTPTVTISCDLTDMAIGTFAGTGTCYTSDVTPTGGTFTWETGSTEISLSCTNSGCGNSVNYTATNPSKAEDDTTITVTYTYSGQAADDTSDPITIHQPTDLRTNSTTPKYTTATCTLPCLANPNTGTCTVKTGTSCSYAESITRRYYSVLDQFGNPFEEVNLSTAPAITESVNASKGSCGGNGVETGKTSGSPFYDDFGKCDSCCESGGPGCTSTASQTLFSNTINVRQESISVTCATATLTP